MIGGGDMKFWIKLTAMRVGAKSPIFYLFSLVETQP